MNNDLIKVFIEKVKDESLYKKFLEKEIIYQLIDIFKGDYNKISYPNRIKNPLEISLQFYKNYNEEYYKMIMDGIQNDKIEIIQGEGKSFVNTNTNTTHIRLYGNDSDIFIIVHELAHYIDKNSCPQIISDDYWFLSETFAFYMEKKLEKWLEYKKYEELISIRRNNRLYYESKMLKAIEIELYYEELYKDKGTIEENDIDFEKIKLVQNYNESNLVNYLLQYPLANILSTHLIEKNIKDNDFINTCLTANLYEIIKNIPKRIVKI